MAAPVRVRLLTGRSNGAVPARALPVRFPLVAVEESI